MSIKNSSFEDLHTRLSLLVDELAEGKVGLFARETGINDKTLYTYLKGRHPSAEALFFICRRFKISLTWLVAGIGPKYIPDDDIRPVHDEDPETAALLREAAGLLTSASTVARESLRNHIRYLATVEKTDRLHRETQAKTMATLARIEQRLADLEARSKKTGGHTGET